MLILADGKDVSGLLPKNDDIRYVHIEEGRTIGEKRNFGSELARGEIVVSWDDDDWSSPDRVSAQLDILRESGQAVCSFHSMLFTDGDRWWKFCGMPTSNLGSSLCYRKDWWQKHRFSAKQVQEDSDFILEAHRHKQLVSVDAGTLMVASVHSGNTSPRQLCGEAWKKVERPAGLIYE